MEGGRELQKEGGGRMERGGGSCAGGEGRVCEHVCVTAVQHGICRALHFLVSFFFYGRECGDAAAVSPPPPFKSDPRLKITQMVCLDSKHGNNPELSIPGQG